MNHARVTFCDQISENTYLGLTYSVLSLDSLQYKTFSKVKKLQELKYAISE